MQPNQVDYESLAARLTVRPPYYAFSRVYVDAGGEWLCGDFTPEHPVGAEQSIIPVAEASRHVAILGTLLGESLSEKKAPSWYLAVNADITEETPSPLESLRAKTETAKQITARVRCRENSANKLTVCGQILFNEQVLNTFIISYVRLNDIQFRFLCGKAATPAVALPVTSPWRVPVPLLMLPNGPGGTRSARIDSHDPLLCAGHFEDYAMWPIAIVMSAATQLITELLRGEYHPNIRFRTVNASMQAKKLLSVADTVCLHAAIDTRQGNRVTVTCRIGSRDELNDVAELNATLMMCEGEGSV